MRWKALMLWMIWRVSLITSLALVVSVDAGSGGTVSNFARQTANHISTEIFASDQMKPALDALADAWKTAYGTPLAITYSSSEKLAADIEMGALADIFVTRDTGPMDELERKGFLNRGTRRNLLGDSLVLIGLTAASAPVKFGPDFDLIGPLGDGKIAVCGQPACPAGVRAKQALEKLDAWSKLEMNLVVTGSSFAAIQLVSQGQARFGIVFATEAKAEPKVKIISAFPSVTYDPIIYPIALLEKSIMPEAKQFLAYFSSQAAVKIFRDKGFSILSR